MVAKRFFYVCAGILCLALAYHLGARSATAQAARLVAASFDLAGDAAGVDEAGQLWALGGAGSPRVGPVSPPRAGRIIAISGDVGGDAASLLATLVYEDGDAYYYTGAAGWSLVGNLFSGPTPATQETWGSVKARYRPGAAAAPQDK